MILVFFLVLFGVLAAIISADENAMDRTAQAVIYWLVATAMIFFAIALAVTNGVNHV